MIDPGIADTYFWDFALPAAAALQLAVRRPGAGQSQPESAWQHADFAVDPGLLGATLRLVYG